ncbi:DUF2637 domain-containing protein [Kocuria sp. HSID16901]|nr:DUF2637 domain-containing protein [Kocuria sp. HSID16901]
MTMSSSNSVGMKKEAAQLEGKTAPTSNSFKEQIRYGSSYQPGARVSSRAGRRINPDSLYTLWFTVILICTLGLTSFMVSFNGLHDVAGWVGLPVWLRWAVPIFIDIAILAYSMAAVIHRARGETVWPTWVTLGVFTALSVVANGAHALTRGEGTTVAQSWIGAGIAAMAPVAVFAATEQLSRLAFAVREEPRPQDEAASDDLDEVFEVPEEAVEPTASRRELGKPQPTEGVVAEESRVIDDVPTSTVRSAEEPAAERPAWPMHVEPVTPEPLQMPREEGLDSQNSDEASPHRPDSESSMESTEDTSGETDSAPTQRKSETVTSESSPVTTTGGKAAPKKAADSVDESSSEEDELAGWVADRLAEGKPVTGAAIGEYLGLSDRTGRNRLKTLQQQRPELFEGAE